MVCVVTVVVVDLGFGMVVGYTRQEILLKLRQSVSLICGVDTSVCEKQSPGDDHIYYRILFARWYLFHIHSGRRWY